MSYFLSYPSKSGVGGLTPTLIGDMRIREKKFGGACPPKFRRNLGGLDKVSWFVKFKDRNIIATVVEENFVLFFTYPSRNEG